jgi:flagellar basal body-associated protein FliL
VAEAKPKVHGSVYVLGKQFLVNLDDAKFAQLTVGLVLAHDDTSTAAAEGHGAAKPPEGFGPMAQEAVVRDVITDELTGLDADELVQAEARAKVKKTIVKALKQHTDVHVEDVLFTDVTVQ